MEKQTDSRIWRRIQNNRLTNVCTVESTDICMYWLMNWWKASSDRHVGLEWRVTFWILLIEKRLVDRWTDFWWPNRWKNNQLKTCPIKRPRTTLCCRVYSIMLPVLSYGTISCHNKRTCRLQLNHIKIVLPDCEMSVIVFTDF